MADLISDLACRLADEAEAVCRHYLSNGRRQGRYWLVGDVENTPGSSLYVRLSGPSSGKGAAGRWTDASTGQYGDLLDLIRLNCGLSNVNEAVDEGRRFLSLPQKSSFPPVIDERRAPTGSPEAARRLFAMSRPIRGTLAETYLRQRGIALPYPWTALRFHPACWYRDDADDHHAGKCRSWPALIAAVTDLDGTLTGLHRTWLDPAGRGKAPVATPRRAMGHLLGQGVRFGTMSDTMLAGEGIETVLSLAIILPRMPMIAALSAAHVAALAFPPGLRRLYVARDDDPAGHRATDHLTRRAVQAGIEGITLAPLLGDFNDDLLRIGTAAFADHLRLQLAPDDVARFWTPP